MTDTFERLRAALADRYAIEQELGSGGMATVYLAEDLKLRRKVAVKVLRPDLAAALGPERFLREIEVAAQLHHPHILPLHDSGEADGFLYYVMPFEEGQSLREKVAKEGELPVAEAVRLLRDVVDALAHAHKQGVVHRDIKPDNGTSPRTSSSAARSRSRSCDPIWPLPSVPSGSSVRSRLLPSFIIRISCRCMTPVKRTVSSTT